MEILSALKVNPFFKNYRVDAYIEFVTQFKFYLNDCPLTPDVEMIQNADTAHQFWLGKLNVPVAIATRKVI